MEDMSEDDHLIFVSEAARQIIHSFLLQDVLFLLVLLDILALSQALLACCIRLASVTGLFCEEKLTYGVSPLRSACIDW